MSTPRYVILSLTLAEAEALSVAAEIGRLSRPDNDPRRLQIATANRHLKERIAAYHRAGKPAEASHD